VSANGFHFAFDPDALRPLIESVVAEAIGRLEAARPGAAAGERLAYGEAEAARLIGLNAHQLRDERRRGRITASVGPGRKILYSLEDLKTYLLSRRWTPNSEQN
jgi:hypothetical protein